jgi:GLPGLI family protein
MKKHMLLSTAIIIYTLCAKAQKQDTAQLLVHYKFSHVQDTANRAHPYTDDMVLLVGTRAGVYKSYHALMVEASYQKQLAEALANSPDGNIRINRISTGPGTEYYQFPHEKKLFLTAGLSPMNAYVMESIYPVITWKISSDTATFGGLHCQKATGRFKGRDYTAWFCPDLPVHTGPWKLNGLPGVILEAYDAKKEVVFKFNGLEKATAYASMKLIKLPADAVKTTEADFTRLKELAQKDPAAFSRMLSIQAAGPDGRGPQMDVHLMPDPVIPNPIELTNRN